MAAPQQQQQQENHLANPSSWATGNDPATTKQKAFLSTLAAEKGVSAAGNIEQMGKGEASSEIGRLKGLESGSGNGSENESKSEKPIVNPAEWATGDEPATGKQKGYIAVMAKQAGENAPLEGLGKGEASQKIGELKGKTGM